MYRQTENVNEIYRPIEFMIYYTKTNAHHGPRVKSWRYCSSCSVVAVLVTKQLPSSYQVPSYQVPVAVTSPIELCKLYHVYDTVTRYIMPGLQVMIAR